MIFKSSELPPPARHTGIKGLRGFTLAEVLVTLGIIGVVAAMTMPTLIANHQKKQVGVKLSKFYSIMSQAVLRWQEDEGLIAEDYKFSDKSGAALANWYNTSIGKYIQTVKKNRTAVTWMLRLMTDQDLMLIFQQQTPFTFSTALNINIVLLNLLTESALLCLCYQTVNSVRTAWEITTEKRF